MKRQTAVRTALTTGAALATAMLAIGCANADEQPAAEAAAAEERSRPTDATEPTEQEITALFDEWNAALATGDPEQVADLYAPDAVLLPTASPEMRTDRAGIVDYFEHFLTLDPSGELVDPVIHVLDEDSALNAGHYEFTINDDDADDGDGDGDGERETVEARYTYEYEKRDGEWLIVNHHSSWLPDED